jgi:hypothetical protein
VSFFRLIWKLINKFEMVQAQSHEQLLDEIKKLEASARQYQQEVTTPTPLTSAPAVSPNTSKRLAFLKSSSK